MSFKAFSNSSEQLPAGISFRPATDRDLPFLQHLYATTRQQEMDLVDWSAEQKDEFLKSQFKVQYELYKSQFADAEFLLIEKDSKAIGRVYLDRRKDEIRLIDIVLLPEHRGAGLGKQLLEGLLHEAAGLGVPVTIQVEKYNKAMRLYTRLGFAAVEEQGVYNLMKWQPGT